MWEIIRDLVAGGVTVFLTTQYLDEADQLADRIAVLDDGRLVAEGTPDELKRLVPGGHIRLQFADPGELDAAAGALGGAVRDDDALALQVPSDGSVAVAARACSTGSTRDAIEVDDLSVHTPDLDDVFLALTGDDQEAPDDTTPSTRLGDHAAPQPPPHAALPVDDRVVRSASRSSSCCCSSTSSAARWAPGSGPAAAAPTTSTTSRPASSC